MQTAVRDSHVSGRLAQTEPAGSVGLRTGQSEAIGLSAYVAEVMCLQQPDAALMDVCTKEGAIALKAAVQGDQMVARIGDDVRVEAISLLTQRDAMTVRVAITQLFNGERIAVSEYSVDWVRIAGEWRLHAVEWNGEGVRHG